MPSLDQPRPRHRAASALTIAIALLLGPLMLGSVYGPISAAAAQTDAGDPRQKLEQLRDVNADAERKAGELRRHMDELEAEAIGPGLLLTLDDAVFTTNNVSFSRSGHRRLDALARFLKQHPKRSVTIYGYAGAGGYRYDQALSTRRADAVKAYLIREDIAPGRLATRSTGETLQGHRDSATEPQRLRHVEVIIEDTLASVRRPDVTAPGT